MPTDVERSLVLAKLDLMLFARDFTAWLDQLDCGKGEALVDVVRENINGSGLDLGARGHALRTRDAAFCP